MPDETPPLADPTHHALFLDFDGTLVGFADAPDAVDVTPDLLATLISLKDRFGGALALVSGRSIGSLDDLLAPARLPAAGVHGLEIRFYDTIESNIAEAERLVPARDHIRNAIADGDSITIEDKGGAIVLHFRAAPSQADRARTIAAEAAATDAGLVAVDGHAIAEIRPRRVTKAGALRQFLEMEPFSGRLPIFIGDDATDEDGMAAANEAGGFAIKVGAGDTVAGYRLADVEAVRRWLRAIDDGGSDRIAETS